MSKGIFLWFIILLAALMIGSCSSAQNATTQPIDLPQKSLPEAQSAISAARQALAERLNVEEPSITLVSVEKAQWRDSCLGIDLPGQVCAQVITPGYKIILDAGGNLHEVHTDETGEAIAFKTPEAR